MSSPSSLPPLASMALVVMMIIGANAQDTAQPQPPMTTPPISAEFTQNVYKFFNLYAERYTFNVRHIEQPVGAPEPSITPNSGGQVPAGRVVTEYTVTIEDERVVRQELNNGSLIMDVLHPSRTYIKSIEDYFRDIHDRVATTIGISSMIHYSVRYGFPLMLNYAEGGRGGNPWGSNVGSHAARDNYIEIESLDIESRDGTKIGENQTLHTYWEKWQAANLREYHFTYTRKTGPTWAQTKPVIVNVDRGIVLSVIDATTKQRVSTDLNAFRTMSSWFMECQRAIALGTKSSLLLSFNVEHNYPTNITYLSEMDVRAANGGVVSHEMYHLRPHWVDPDDSRISVVLILVVLIIVILFLVLCITFCVVLYRRNKQKKQEELDRARQSTARTGPTFADAKASKPNPSAPGAQQGQQQARRDDGFENEMSQI